jgi:hypothetical protein
MRGKQLVLVVGVAFFAGLLGGMLANKVLTTTQVFAETKKRKIIEAHEFRLVNENGKTLALFGKDTLGKHRDVAVLRFGEKTDFPHTYLWKNGLVCFSESWINTFNDTGFHVYEKTDEGIVNPFSILLPPATLQKRQKLLGHYAYPGLKLSDKNDKTRCIFGLDWETGLPSIKFFSGLLEKMAEFSLSESGEPNLKLYDDKKNLRAVLGPAEFKDKRTKSTIIRPVSSLVLFDEKGNAIWSAP